MATQENTDLQAARQRLANFHPMSPETIEDPYAFHDAMRREEPVYPVPGLGFFMVASHAAVSEVIADPARFSSKVGAQAGGPAPGGVGEDGKPLEQVDTLLTADPPDHIRYRSLVSRAFAARRVARMEGYIRGIAAKLVDGFAAKGAVDLVPEFCVPLPLSVIADQLGVPRDDMPLFKKWSDDIVSLLSGVVGAEQAAEAQRSIQAFSTYMTAKIEERRQQGAPDMLTDLIEARLDGEDPLNLAEMLSILQQFLVAGNETTTNMIASAMMLLLKNPDQMALVRADFGLIPNMLEEALRLESPVQGLFRMATGDTEVAGTKIPGGARLIVSYASANRDAAVFPDPDRFDVTRPNLRQHLAFGQGEHFCIAAALARKEGLVAFETLFGKLGEIRLASGNDFTHVPSFILRGLKQLQVEFDPA